MSVVPQTAPPSPPAPTPSPRMVPAPTAADVLASVGAAWPTPKWLRVAIAAVCFAAFLLFLAVFFGRGSTPMPLRPSAWMRHPASSPPRRSRRLCRIWTPTSPTS